MHFLCLNRYLIIMTTACIRQKISYANLMLGGLVECRVGSREYRVQSTESGVRIRVLTPDSKLQTPDCYCASDIRICTPARVLVMGGEVEILGIVRRWSK